jgi:hypothetical protein
MLRALGEQLRERLEREVSALHPKTQHVLRVLRAGMGAPATASAAVLGNALAEGGWEGVEAVWEALDALVEVSLDGPMPLSFEALATGVRAARAAEYLC